MVLTSTTEIIETLGGIDDVARLTGRKYNAVSNWQVQGYFPSNTFLILNAALKEHGDEAPASLWRMVEAVE